MKRYCMNRKDIVKHFYEVVVSNNMLDELPQYIDEDCTVTVGENRAHIGLDGMRQHLVAVRGTYPDYTMKIIRQYEDGDTVVSEFIMRGTHSGEFLGITPTKRVIEITGVDIDKVVDGRSLNMAERQTHLMPFGRMA
jgi:Predicted ester cyclase